MCATTSVASRDGDNGRAARERGPESFFCILHPFACSACEGYAEFAAVAGWKMNGNPASQDDFINIYKPNQ
ncbi:MAG: hypothetical protein ACYCZD_12990 [Rhodanobacter sp.]